MIRPDPIRVFLVDDQTLVRQGIRSLLALAEGIEVVAEAAHDAKRKVQVLEFCHQPPDHPVLVTMPESEYLRGYILRVE